MSRLVRPVLRLTALTVLAALALFAPLASADSRPPEPMDAARLMIALQRLQNTGTVLYIGAHPDDENTAMLCWLTRGRYMHAAYLSLTRGDGGQNLIGTEAGDALGVLRTQELLAARRIDGAEQFFTRAVDFGFSKNPDEALAIWNHDLVLADVVRVIREYQPDVVITRFGTDGSGGHGHHTASAMLAGEAFTAAADRARFPELGLAPWKAKRLLWNNWQPKPARADSAAPALLTVDVGGYQPLLARSYTEIAGLSRSMHKSQGFGSAERRGSNPQYLQLVAGESATTDLLDGVELGWRRVAGGERVGALLAAAAKAFDPRDPAAIVPTLVRAEVAARALPQAPWVVARRMELRDVIRGCAGLWLEAVATRPTVAPGAKLSVRLTLLERSNAAIDLHRIEMVGPPGQPVLESRIEYGFNVDSAMASRLRAGKARGATPRNPATGVPVALAANRPLTASAEVTVPPDAAISQPYWLRAPAQGGAFSVADARQIGAAEDPPAITARVVLGFGADTLAFALPVVYRWVDPVEGERYRPVEIAPPVTLRLDRGAYLFADASPREVRVTVDRADTSLAGRVILELPEGWSVTPSDVAPEFVAGASSAQVSFRVTPSANAHTGNIVASFRAGDRAWSNRLVTIDHSHVPLLALFPPARARIVRADARCVAAAVGYVMGSGDAVPEALAQLGMRVTMLTDDDVELGDLSRFAAIVIGVRAYNTHPRVLAAEPRLRKYVVGGGRLIVQYQTPDGTLDNKLGPYPFTVSRDRVSVEGAEMRVLRAGHPLLSSPNPIGPADFEGWVQERGLSYANPFDPRYETVLSANDPGETPKDGGVLYAREGAGTYAYTGLALFRQLPAGVAGAYRLLANLVSPEPAR